MGGSSPGLLPGMRCSWGRAHQEGPDLTQVHRLPVSLHVGAQEWSRGTLGGGFSSRGVVVAWVIISSIYLFIYFIPQIYFTSMS